MGSAQSRWVLKFGPIVPRKLGANGSLLTRRWREMDSNPRSPVRSLTQTRSNGECSAPVCGVAHDDRDADRVRDRRLCAGRSRRRPGRGPECMGAGGAAQLADRRRRLDRGLDRARDPTFRCTAQVNRRLPTLTPPRFGAKRLEQRRDWRISENMIGVRS